MNERNALKILADRAERNPELKKAYEEEKAREKAKQETFSWYNDDETGKPVKAID